MLTATATATARTLRTPLGRLTATPGALDAFTTEELAASLKRHQSGDWGDLSAGDKQANDRAARDGNDRILSAYEFPSDRRLWIITEWDRSVTTLLLPEEY